MAQKKLVSVIVFAESIPADLVEKQIKNVISQFYENKEIIVIHDKNRNDLDDLIMKYSFQNCKFVSTENIIDGVSKIYELVNGDIIFYKTCNPIDWMPRHIDIHVDMYETSKCDCIQSIIEYKDLANPNNLMNTINWRLEKPTPEDFELDEISNLKSLKIDWESSFVENMFNKKKFLLQLSNGQLTKEISCIKWFNTQLEQKNQIAMQLGLPNTQNQLQEKHFPTILGNILQYKRNKLIWEDISKLDSNEILSIVIKRTAGMGDVIMTEPIKRYLKNKYPNSKITLVTSESRGIGNAAKILGYDDVIFIPETNLIHDALMTTINSEELAEDTESGILTIVDAVKYDYNNYQIKIDLDMSYESRHKPYLMSYFEMINVDYNTLSEEEKYYNFDIKNNNVEKIKDFYLHREGSGWVGKTLPDEKWDSIKNDLQKQYSITEGKFYENFSELIYELQSHKYYMGTDSGIMHIALGLGLRCFIVCGAALPEFTASQYLESGQIISIHASQEALPCLGCKINTFIELLENGQITFVPMCRNQNGNVCMTGIVAGDVSKIIMDIVK